MPNFNWFIYVNKYKDLLKNGISSKGSALYHWDNHGKDEGRDSDIEYFDWEYYILENDLSHINNYNDAAEHWINYGMYESLQTYDNVFDWQDYIERYPDLKDANIDTEYKALCHWRMFGQKEDRKINTDFKIYDYFSISNISDFINLYAKESNVLYNSDNYIDVDLFFYKKANNLSFDKKNELLQNFYTNGYTGLIYHPKQILNMYPLAKILYANTNIYIEFNKQFLSLDVFVKNYIYIKDINYFNSILVQNKITSLTKKTTLLILVFIGNLERGAELIDKIINYKDIENFSLGICFNSDELYQFFIKKIITNFTDYAIYISTNFGNDITPTMLMYRHIMKKYKYEYIIKLQTKSDIKKFNDLTDFLLEYPLLELLKNNDSQRSNCIGHPKYLFSTDIDIWNKIYYQKYCNYIIRDNYFIEGTIFCVSSDVFDLVLHFIETNNFKEYLLNNMYDNNTIFVANSPIHFIERLYGIIKK